MLTPGARSSGPTDSLAPPPSPYPTQIEPSPVDSNGTESTEIEEDAQDDSDVKSPASTTAAEVKSPDVEISSPQSASSVCLIGRRLCSFQNAHNPLRNDLRRSSHSCPTTHAPIPRKRHRSRSSMFPQGSKISATDRQAGHCLRPINQLLFCSRLLRPKPLKAPARR